MLLYAHLTSSKNDGVFSCVGLCTSPVMVTLFSFLQAMDMLRNTRDTIPMIFLITDGAVEDERQICDVMKSRLTNQGTICPRVHTFGIGIDFGVKLQLSSEILIPKLVDVLVEDINKTSINYFLA